MTADPQTLFRFAEFEHRYVCQQIALADSKASAVFAGASFAIALAVPVLGPAALAGFPALGPLAVIAGIACLLAAAACAFLVLMPRARRAGQDPIYFADVAGRSDGAAYLAELNRLCVDPVLAAERIATSAHALAGVCARKFRVVRTALLLLAVGVLLLAARIAGLG